MYVETKGYIIMKEDEMNFYDDNCEFSEELDCAKVYESYSDAKEDCEDLIEEFGKNYEIVRYNKTIWIDKVGLENQKTTICTCCQNEEEEIDE